MNAKQVATNTARAGGRERDPGASGFVPDGIPVSQRFTRPPCCALPIAIELMRDLSPI